MVFSPPYSPAVGDPEAREKGLRGFRGDMVKAFTKSNYKAFLLQPSKQV
ncbi:MAG: hypothetical protein QXL55_07240 [Nitrososphaerota archaeon]